MSNRNTEAVVDEAAEWVVRMGGSDLSLDERREFVAWLKRSPVHLQQYLRIEGTWAQLQHVDPLRKIELDVLGEGDTNIVEIKDAVSPPPAPPRMRKPLFWGWAVAASIVLVVGASVWLQLGSRTHFTTATGEQRTLKLPDGSTVVLNTQTDVYIEFSDTLRQVRLAQGEALFKVAKDPRRPFRVSSDRAVAQAIGTVFNVRKQSKQTVVTVIEGQVAVARPLEAERISPARLAEGALRLAAGARADIAEKTIQTRTLESPAAALAWQSRRLIFQGESLAEVVEEFNRYNEQRIVLEDARLAQERISGVFDADQPQALVRFLEHSRVVRTIQTTPDRIVLSGDVR